MHVLKNFGLLIIASGLGYYFSPHTGELYIDLFNPPPTLADLDFRSLIGLPLSYIFFIALLFTAFGGKPKYWWMAILLIPAAIVELYLEKNYLYFPILLGLAGSFIGLGIGKLLPKR